MEAEPGQAAIGEMGEFAAEVARAGGAILRDRFGQPHDIAFKGEVDLVTEADEAAETAIASMIRTRYPDHDLLGEEGARGATAASPFRWVIDPLDGTTNFAHNLPHFAVSIGLEYAGRPLLGAVYDPLRNELFRGTRGLGATLNDAPLHVSPTTNLLQALLGTGFSYDLERRIEQAAVWRRFILKVQAIRQTGSAALNLCYVAAGRLDGYWERGIRPWDVSAGVAVLQEAGGQASDFQGGPFRSDDRVILASNGHLHETMIAIIQSRDGGGEPG